MVKTDQLLNNDPLVPPSGKKPEIIIGLVGPLGTDLSLVVGSLTEALKAVSYRAEQIRISHLMHDLSKEPWSKLRSFTDHEQRLKKHMDAGNEFRKVTGRDDAMALLAVNAIMDQRKQITKFSNIPAEKVAFILNSLKRPEEVQTLRRLYGSAFLLVACYAPRSKRVEQVAKQIAESRYSNKSDPFISTAIDLLERDASELNEPNGQNARDTFPLADVVVDVSEPTLMADELNRFVEIVYGNPFHTPTVDEQGMHLAHAAAARSASLARQVGAAICRSDGSLIAIGANEVPKAGGGQYWVGDKNDRRDFRIGYDTSDRMKENVLADILAILKQKQWLSTEKSEQEVADMVQECLAGKGAFMRGAQLWGTIDFVRAVHAEMAALTDAARNGVSTTASTLYTTTFPCHDCAKHVIAAGVRRVVCVEPYPKSLVTELYPDSIVVDSAERCTDRVEFVPFVGIAPNRYLEFFALRGKTRKRRDGNVKPWSALDAAPLLPSIAVSSSIATLALETEEAQVFFVTMERLGFVSKNSEN